MEFCDKYHRKKVPILSHLIRYTLYQNDLTQIMFLSVTWLRQCLSGFSNIKQPILSHYSTEANKQVQPTLQSGRDYSQHPEGERIYTLFGIFCKDHVSFIFIYSLVNHIFITLWTYRS